MRILERMNITCIENKCMRKGSDHKPPKGWVRLEICKKEQEQNLFCSELQSPWHAFSILNG